jgi:large subunit ribosomal protein L17
MAIIREKNVVHKLFNDAPTRFSSKAGGYTRLVKVGLRKGDAAVLSMVELTGEPVASPKEDKKKASKPETKAAKKEKPPEAAGE